jgi:integrase
VTTEGLWSGWEVRQGKTDNNKDNAKMSSADRKKKERQETNLRAKHNVYAKVRQRLAQHAPGLAKGDLDGPLALDTVLEKVLEGFEGQQLKWAHNFVILGIDKGNKEHLWDLPVPPAMNLLRHEKVFFTPTDVQWLPHTRAMHEHLLGSLAREDEYDRKGLNLQANETARSVVNAGELVLCFIALGGLTDSRILRQLIKNWSYEQPLITEQEFAWVDVFDINAEKESVLCRRWFPDPVSELLIYRWHEAGHQWPSFDTRNNKMSAAIFRWVDAYLRATGFKIVQAQPKTLLKLCDRLSLHSNLMLPGYLGAYASGRMKSTPLSAVTWHRVRTGIRASSIATSEPLELQETGLDPSLIHLQAVNVRTVDQQRSLQVLLRAFKPGRNKEYFGSTKAQRVVETFLQDHAGQLSIGVQLLAHWMLSLLQNGSRYKRNLEVKTVRQYTSNLARLPDLLGNDNLLEYGIEELLDLYQTLLQNAPTAKSRTYLSGRLDEFHYFLSLRANLPRINIKELYDGPAIGSDVDANFITEQEFQQIYSELERQDPKHHRLYKMRRMLLILGYRLGLRRSEAWKLKISQVCGKNRPELLVMGKVKSASARRRLPLLKLMPPDEVKVFLDWVAVLKREQGKAPDSHSNAYLFCSDLSEYELTKESLLFDPLHDVMRAVTNDLHLRFHHLRHSLASSQLIRLQDANTASLSKFFEHRFIADLNNKDRTHLAHNHLYELALTMGHHAPEVTIGHYCHWHDLMLHYCQSQNLPECSVETVSRLTSISVAALYKAKKRQAIDSFLLVARAHQRKHYAKLFQDPITGNHIQVTTPISWPDSDLKIRLSLPEEQPIRLVHSVLESVMEAGVDICEAASLYGCSEKSIALWMQAAQSLTNTNTSKAGIIRGSRKREAGHDSPARLLPTRPTIKADIFDATEAVKKLNSLRQQNEELLTWAIEYFLRNKTSSHTHLLMSGPEDGERYVAFLKEIEVSKDRISIVLTSQSENARAAEKQLKHWATILGLSKNQFISDQSLVNKSSDWGVGYLTVLSKIPRKNGERESSYGLHYALCMYAILLRAERPPNTKPVLSD